MSYTQHITCPHCAAINNVPTTRQKDQPNCGKCHKPLFHNKPVELTSGNFLKHVTKNEIPVVIDFWAPWCGPCKMMAPAYEQACSQLEPEFRLAKLNTEKEQAIAAKYRIQSIPTLAIFKNGKEIARQAGAMNTGDIVRWVRSNS